MKTKPPGHTGKSTNINTFKALLSRKSLLERLAPVLGELLWMVQGRKNASVRKRALPDYCYKILQVLQKTHFKILPMADSFGHGPETLNWDALGKVIGAGLRCLRFGELEWDKIVAREISPDAETIAMVKMIGTTSWLGKQEGASAEDLSGNLENRFVKGAEELWAAATGCQQAAYQSGAGPMAQLSGGIQKGTQGFLDESGQFMAEHARDNIYWFLLIVWPEIQEMQHSGDKTRKDFSDWIQPFASEGLVSIRDLDQLLDVCDDIGLKFKGRGAPRKK
jgi:hypothetical protein